MDPTTPVADPAAFRAAAEQAGLTSGVLSQGLVVHAKGIAGIYGFMILLCLWSFAVRYRYGKLWLVQRNRVGVFRPNAAVWVPMFLMLYSMLWIGLITIYIEGDTTKPHATYSALIFFPLSFAGWIQVYGTVSAIPWRSGIIKLHAKDVIYRSRTSRLLESQLVRNAVLFLIPFTYLALMIVPSINLGQSQANTHAVAKSLLVEVDAAIADGWSAAGLARASKAGKQVIASSMNSKKYYQWCAIVMQVWTVLDLMIYL